MSTYLESRAIGWGRTARTATLCSASGRADLIQSPSATLTVERGARDALSTPTTDPRALESPDGAERRAGVYYDVSQVGLRLTFGNAYAGSLHLYAVDWAGAGRRERVTVADGTGPQVAELSRDFDQGAWLNFPITVAAGASVTVTLDRLAGPNVLVNGLFLGHGDPPVLSPPGAPTLAPATAGDASVALSWTPGSTGGAAITNYRVYRGTTSGNLALLTTLGAVTSYTDTAVANGTTYVYQVSAVNSVGEGPRSVERSATPTAPATVPGAPTDLTAAGGNTSVALGWTAPTSTGGSALTGYDVYRGTTAATCPCSRPSAS